MREENNYTFAGCYYSDDAQDVLRPDGSSASLRRQSVAVFRFLAEHPNRVVSRDELSAGIWQNTEVTDDSLTKCISEIRKALNDNERKILVTLPRRGYRLVADTNTTETAVSRTAFSKGFRSYVWLAPAVLLMAVAGYFIVDHRKDHTTEPSHTKEDGIPHVALDSRLADSGLANELRVALSRYRTVKLSNLNSADMVLRLQPGVGSNVAVELINKQDDSLLFAESYDEHERADDKFLARVAAAVASPGVGAIDTWLLKSTRLIPVDQLSNAACYAYGFGCSKCSGEEDTITRRAEACLAAILEKDPQDARAWALQATIYAHQYWWANTLPEPLRSNPALRQHLPQKAIDAAHKAESLSHGGDTGVYWGMAEAYFSACEADKLNTAIKRGLGINPNDPHLLGAFGNWLAYSGRWEEGAAMTLRALEIEPVNYRRWWWMGPAKAAYVKGDFEQAYKYFLKSFNERNWMSHLQQAYTLPHLGRVDDARKSVSTLQYMYPGFTREKALEIYDLLCFPDSFLRQIDEALTAAGLPSRGSSNDLSNIALPRAEVASLNGIDIEYLDVGSGEPVVFVHGAFNDYRTWGHYMVPVSEAHRYLSYSRRYFGTQDWRDDGEQFSVEVFAEDLINLIENLGLEKVHVVTWSSGVRTAMAAGAMRPDLFKSMIHFEPVEGSVMQGMDNESHIKELSKAWGVNYGPIVKNALSGNNEEAVAKFYELVFEVPPGSYEQEREIIREVTRQNAHTIAVNLTRFGKDKIKLTCDYVSQVKVPTLVVVGEKTHEFWQLMSRRFADCLPNADLEVIRDSNHYAPIEKIDEFASLVLKYVDSHR